MICRVFAPALVQVFPPCLVEFEVARQATSGLFDVGSCLIEGQWKAAKGLDDGCRLSANRVRNACKCSVWWHERCSTQQEEDAFICSHRFDIYTLCSPTHAVGACRQEYMSAALAGKECIGHWQVVGVIDNQEPVGMFFKPAFDRFYCSTLIFSIFFWKLEEIGKGHYL